MSNIRGLNHLHLIVRDMPRAVRFYGEAFGYHELFHEGDEMVFLGLEGGYDVLTLNVDPAQQARAGDNGGIAHFGFKLADVDAMDAAIEAVERAGGALQRRGEHAPGIPFAYVTDPDGYVIELG